MNEFADLVLEVGDAYLALGEHKHALRYYQMLDGNTAFDNVRPASVSSLSGLDDPVLFIDVPFVMV